MNSLLATWQSMTMRRRATVLGAIAAMTAAVLAIAQIATQPSMSLLYSGIDSSNAGDVLAALDQKGVRYEVRGSAIYVDGAQRDALRMSLAAEGLPAAGAAGYELLDSLSGFGTTAQMFDAAYWRAKEGELARTISSAANIRQARVHIANPAPAGLRQQARPTASVTITTAAEGLSGAQAKALRYLVASAVSGMAPQDVAIIDSQTGLVAAGDKTGAETDTDRAEALRHNVERLLEARVGYGNAIVEVAVETTEAHEAITERRFDPQGRVVISTDTEQANSSASGSAAGAVTVASNLPAGDAKSGGGGTQNTNAETRERVNYEVSETTREVVKAPGAVSRLTVAVLVNDPKLTGSDGKTATEPRSAEELGALRELVESAVGFNEARGDRITLKSMPFEPVPDAGTAAPAGILASLQLDVMTLIQLAVLALVSLVLGLFVVRPLLTRKLVMAPPVQAALPGMRDGSLPGPALTGEIQTPDAVQPPALRGGTLPTEGAELAGEDPVERLRRLIQERRGETVEILRGWMEDRRSEDA